MPRVQGAPPGGGPAALLRARRQFGASLYIACYTMLWYDMLRYDMLWQLIVCYVMLCYVWHVMTDGQAAALSLYHVTHSKREAWRMNINITLWISNVRRIIIKRAVTFEMKRVEGLRRPQSTIRVQNPNILRSGTLIFNRHMTPISISQTTKHSHVLDISSEAHIHSIFGVEHTILLIYPFNSYNVHNTTYDEGAPNRGPLKHPMIILNQTTVTKDIITPEEQLIPNITILDILDILPFLFLKLPSIAN